MVVISIRVNEWIAEIIMMKIVVWIILFWCILYEILCDQSMHVNTCVHNNSIRVIGHNYMNNGRNFNPSKRLDSWDNNDDDCSVDYFILMHIVLDTTWSKYACKNMRIKNNSIRVIGHNYMNNGCNFNPSKQMDSREDNNEDCSVDYFM